MRYVHQRHGSGLDCFGLGINLTSADKCLFVRQDDGGPFSNLFGGKKKKAPQEDTPSNKTKAAKKDEAPPKKKGWFGL